MSDIVWWWMRMSVLLLHVQTHNLFHFNEGEQKESKVHQWYIVERKNVEKIERLNTKHKKCRLKSIDKKNIEILKHRMLFTVKEINVELK